MNPKKLTKTTFFPLKNLGEPPPPPDCGMDLMEALLVCLDVWVFQWPGIPRETQLGDSQPPRFSTPLGDSCDSTGSHPPEQKKKVYKKKRKKSEAGSELLGVPADMLLHIPRPPLEDVDSPALGPLTGSIRDVYEVVQFLVDAVSLEVDGMKRVYYKRS